MTAAIDNSRPAVMITADDGYEMTAAGQNLQAAVESVPA